MFVLPALNYTRSDVDFVRQAIDLADRNKVAFARAALNVTFDQRLTAISQANGGRQVLPASGARSLVAHSYVLRERNRRLTPAGAARTVVQQLCVDARRGVGTAPKWVIFSELWQYWGPHCQAALRHVPLNVDGKRVDVSVGIATPDDVAVARTMDTLAHAIVTVRPPRVPQPPQPYLRIEWSSPDPVNDDGLSYTVTWLCALVLLWSGETIKLGSRICYPLSPFHSVRGLTRVMTYIPKGRVLMADPSLPPAWSGTFEQFLRRWDARLNVRRATLGHRFNAVLLYLLRAAESPDLAGFTVNLCTAIEALAGGGGVTGQRFAKLAADNGHPALELLEAWRRLYKLRCNIVHGQLGMFGQFPGLPEVAPGHADRRDWLALVRYAVLKSLTLKSAPGDRSFEATLDRLLLG